MKIAICGLGRAGKALAQKIIDEKTDELVLGLCREESKTKGMDVGDILGTVPLNVSVVPLSSAVRKLKEKQTDIVIDFSNKDTSVKLLKVCEEAGVNLVICTTNFSEEEKEMIRTTAENEKIGVVEAPNLTIGINLLMEFVGRLSRILPEFDFEIVERHRKEKVRPTATAKLIAREIDRDEVVISSVRAGGYVGIHEVTAASEEERITIEHESFTRGAFAKGAMLAARFVYGKKGYFRMADVVKEMENEVLK